MATPDTERCRYLERLKKGYGCSLRKQELPIQEVSQKCADADLFMICIDALSSLNRGLESIKEGSTDAFPWLMEASNQFENLTEIDNAVLAAIKAIDFAVELNLTERAYTFYSYGRTIFEEGLKSSDAALLNPALKQSLIKSGQSIIAKITKTKDGAVMTDMQAELKASILGGISLKKVEKEESREDLVISHGKSLYEKMAKEYRESATNYIDSGLIKNAVIFVCMAALANLMLGKPKEGISYLTNIAKAPDNREEFNNNPCFEWTKLIFKALVSRNKESIEKAKTLFLKIPWSYKDDKEFARRAMDSVERRVSH
ncbi:MAG: hypothetical protein ACTSUO_08865 [Candidatus Thorarchaeota archaeon]